MNCCEGVCELLFDIEEGVDVVMVKFVMLYLDVLVDVVVFSYIFVWVY